MKSQIRVFNALALILLLGAFSGICQTGAGSAVLTVASSFPTPPGGANPLAGRALVLMKESFAGFLQRSAMFQGPPGSSAKVSPLTAWAVACQIQSPACKQALFDAQANFVGNVHLDSNGRATFPGVAPGTYYVFGQALVENHQVVWDLKVDLKPGVNSVTLDARNKAILDTDQPQSGGPGNGTQSGSQTCHVTDTPRTHKPVVGQGSNLAVGGAGYTYTYRETNRATGQVVNSFTEKGNFTDTTLYLLDEDAESIFERSGIGPGLLGSRFAMLAFFDAGTQVEDFPGMQFLATMLGHSDMLKEVTQLAKADLDCAMKAIRLHSLAEVTTDANARAVFPSVPPGTYYIYGRFYRIHKPFRAGGMFWNLRVELKPGPNVIRLSVENAAWKTGT